MEGHTPCRMDRAWLSKTNGLPGAGRERTTALKALQVWRTPSQEQADWTWAAKPVQSDQLWTVPATKGSWRRHPSKPSQKHSKPSQKHSVFLRKREIPAKSGVSGNLLNAPAPATCATPPAPASATPDDRWLANAPHSSARRTAAAQTAPAPGKSSTSYVGDNP